MAFFLEFISVGCVVAAADALLFAHFLMLLLLLFYHKNFLSCGPTVGDGSCSYFTGRLFLLLLIMNMKYFSTLVPSSLPILLEHDTGDRRLCIFSVSFSMDVADTYSRS